jgi:hypothetical protein
VRELCWNSDRELILESLRCIWVSAYQDYPMTLPQSEWFANYSKSFICCSYVICAFTYHIVELVFVLSYIWSRVWGSVEYSGTQCGDYHSIPRRLTALIRLKILESAVDEMLEALSMVNWVPLSVIILLGTPNLYMISWMNLTTFAAVIEAAGFTSTHFVNLSLQWRCVWIHPLLFWKDLPNLAPIWKKAK